MEVGSIALKTAHAAHRVMHRHYEVSCGVAIGGSAIVIAGALIPPPFNLVVMGLGTAAGVVGGGEFSYTVMTNPHIH